MQPTINIYKNISKLSENFAKRLVDLLENSYNKNNNFNLLLPGGKTPLVIYDYIADNYTNKPFWDVVHFFWGDERCVPSDYPESNFGQASKRLFKKVRIALSNMHPIVGENHPYLEADRYSTLIHKHFNIINEIPEFDLIILGVGVDGHIASLFPDQLNIFNSNRLYEVATHPDTGQQRITVTGKIINNASNIFFLVTGKNKSEILSTILKKKENYDKLPASLVYPKLGNIEWFIDKEAASLL